MRMKTCEEVWKEREYWLREKSKNSQGWDPKNPNENSGCKDQEPSKETARPRTKEPLKEEATKQRDGVFRKNRKMGGGRRGGRGEGKRRRRRTEKRVGWTVVKAYG